jgi:hypothetical protein
MQMLTIVVANSPEEAPNYKRRGFAKAKARHRKHVEELVSSREACPYGRAVVLDLGRCRGDRSRASAWCIRTVGLVGTARRLLRVDGKGVRSH